MAKSSTRKVSSPRSAKLASKALRDRRTSKTTKSLAGAVLAQARSKRK